MIVDMCTVQISYRIKVAGVDHDKFSINKQNGLLTTTISFDSEMKRDYYITVIAEDGVPSDRPNHYPSGTPNQGRLITIRQGRSQAWLKPPKKI